LASWSDIFGSAGGSGFDFSSFLGNLQNQYQGGGYAGAGNSGASGQQQQAQSGIQGFSAPAANAGLSGLTSWLQNNYAQGLRNYDSYAQSHGQAAQKAKEDALNAYNTTVSGLQGLMGGLTQQAQQQQQSLAGQQANIDQMMAQAMQLYDPQQWAQVIATGQVPQATQDYYQQMRDLAMSNVQSDLDKSFAVQQRQLMDNLGARGILNSSITGNALAQMEAEKQRRLSQASADATAQMIQGLIDAPYRQQEAALQNLGGQSGFAQSLGSLASQFYQNQLGGLAQQGNWGINIPQAMAPLYTMASGMYDIPAAMREAYAQPMLNIWGKLADSATAEKLAQMRIDESADSDWFSGIGSLVGAIGGLF